MRHANIRTTINVYGSAMLDSKRSANSKIVIFLRWLPRLLHDQVALALHKDSSPVVGDKRLPIHKDGVVEVVEDQLPLTPIRTRCPRECGTSW